VSLLVSAEHLRGRRAIAADELAPLATGLRLELAPVIDAPPEIPREKALLSRAGGRCTIDGAQLRFDPFDPRHFCPVCGREYAGGLHDRYRLYWYQLWLAERTVHSALLGVLTHDDAARATAIDLLQRYAEQYLRYPNADNVLGPSRPFFSTYLESIWLLQLTVALDLLETGAPSAEVTTLGALVRDRLIAPSAALIASYDEGMSNRQVWNNAALMAAARLLDDRVILERALHGRSGLHAHLELALLADGSWYEGENYHLFAHRGLWYGSQIAATAGQPLPTELSERFHDGFAAPFRTVLPDLTYPSRRDSQYAVSVRQPRFAEACELGLAYADDDRLVGMLARLYDDRIPRGDTGRWASSADVERNVPATGLSRADLSWRSLLCARPILPPLVEIPLRSDLLPAQGLGILRRDEGSVYVSLDYGHSGGGHGHPDRLNLTLVDGARRWFDDPGTGSYVDPSLHWYRSTLAHNAPIVDGRSQPRVHGELLSFMDGPCAGWMSAYAELAPGLTVRRTVVVLEDYLVEELHWESAEPHEIALPIHGVSVVGDDVAARVAAPISGGPSLEDGFGFLADTTLIATPDDGLVSLVASGAEGEGPALRGCTFVERGTSIWLASVPAAPGLGTRAPLVLLRRVAPSGRFLSVWSWKDSVASASLDDEVLSVVRRSGGTDRHSRLPLGWQVERIEHGASSFAVLGGATVGLPPLAAAHPLADDAHIVGPAIPLPAAFELGELHYRRSEFTWEGAGAPRATVTITRPTPGTVHVDVDVPYSLRLFVPLTTENQLDNESASINGDSVQLYAVAGLRTAGLLLVPDGSMVTVRPVDGWTNDLSVDARWRPTADGYRIEATIHIDGRTPEFALDVLVNEVVPGRARRRGQLVMSGAAGEFVYLRGDRHDPLRLLRFKLTNG
jgi:hypothetical protein